MPGRTLVVAATNVLARGFFVIPIDRMSPDGEPVNALLALARAVHRALAFKKPSRAVAVVESAPPSVPWPPMLEAQRPKLATMLRALALTVVEAPDEEHVVASYARAAIDAGDDVIVVGVDKRFAQLVSDRLWWYDANKDVRYTPEIVTKRFGVGPVHVGEWLALVGDDSGNEVLPGVKGIGAKGATTLVAEHGSISRALERAGSIEGRIGKAVAAAREEIPRELARGRLDTTRALPIGLDDDVLRYTPPDPSALNALYERLGFVELLSAREGGPSTKASGVEICEQPSDLAEALAKLGSADALAVHALVEDPAPVRSAVAGVALGNGNGEGCYVPHASGAWPELARWLEDERTRKIGHGLASAIVDLERAGVALRGIVGDSACASHLTQPSNWAPHDLTIVSKQVLGRALPEDDAVRGVGKQRRAWRALSLRAAAEHAIRLADASAAIWQRLSPPLPSEQLAEYLEMTELCARLELTGIAVDASELDRAEVAFADIEKELDEKIFELAGHPFNINSSKQLGSVLFEELRLPIASHTKTGWSTSIEALERIEHAHPIIALVLRWRALRRLRDNWVLSLRRCIDIDGRVHSRFHAARSFSGRLVNTNPDLARVPGRTPEMARIRRAFVAPPGRLLLSVDFHQLGLYVLAHLTKDPALVEPLRRGADMHVLTAAAVLERSPGEITAEQRQIGKVVNFATFAGQGASALALQLGISAQDAKAYIARFDRHYSKVRAFQDEQLRMAREEGGIVTLAGRRWPIGGLESLDSHDRSYAERLARRATHEASVQDVARRALLDVDRAIGREGLGALPLLQILDEVLFEVPERELTRAARVCADAMMHAYDLEVPLVVGVEAGKNWADLEPVRLD